MKPTKILSVEIVIEQGNRKKYLLTTDVGVMTVAQLADHLNITHDTVRKRAKDHGWDWPGVFGRLQTRNGKKTPKNSNKAIRGDDRIPKDFLLWKKAREERKIDMERRMTVRDKEYRRALQMANERGGIQSRVW